MRTVAGPLQLRRCGAILSLDTRNCGGKIDALGRHNEIERGAVSAAAEAMVVAVRKDGEARGLLGMERTETFPFAALPLQGHLARDDLEQQRTIVAALFEFGVGHSAAPSQLSSSSVSSRSVSAARMRVSRRSTDS